VAYFISAMSERYCTVSLSVKNAENRSAFGKVRGKSGTFLRTRLVSRLDKQREIKKNNTRAALR